MSDGHWQGVDAPSGGKEDLRRKRYRSRVTNGRDLLAGVDGRSPTYRRYRDLVRALGKDQGEPAPSEARLQLIRRFAACGCLAEAMEAKYCRGEDIDIGEYTALASAQVRIASRIGIERMPKTIKPLTLADLEPEVEPIVDGEASVDA